MVAVAFCCALIALAAFLLAAAPAQAQSGELHQRTLPNGLEVIVQEDHSAPLVCSFIWYRVGLRHEPQGEAGITHFLEHMAFKGTERLTGREMNRLVTAQGGYLNGFTSLDYTAYVETLPRDALELAFQIESERMAHCLLAAEDVESEKGVVLSEFEGAENDPSFLLRRKVMETQFPGQPYGRQVIGEKDDLRLLTREQVLHYYRGHYAPGNALLVVVGDVEANAVFAQAERFFGPIPKGEPLPPVPNPGRGATGERRVSLEVPGRTSYLQVVYEVPPILHPDHAVLEVLQNILSGGRTARLYRALVDTQLASQAGAWEYENPQPTAFAFEIALHPTVAHQQAEQALDAFLQDLRENPVATRELEKARNQTKAQFIYSADGVTGRAYQIGYYHLIADHEYLAAFPERVDAVTADDIQRVVRSYFTLENRTVGWLVATDEASEPQPSSSGAQPPQTRWGFRQEPPTRADDPDRGARVAAPPGLGLVPPIHALRLDNGMQVILQENHGAPFVVVYGNIMAGPVFDPPAKAGLAAFCAEMMSRGTQQRTWQQIREDLESVAADLGSGHGAQVATVSGRCLKGDLELLLQAAAEQLILPAFPEEEVEKVRAELIAAQQSRDEDTGQVAEQALFARLYPEEHPLHHPRLGTSQAVSSISRDDLVAFHARYYRPENTILAIVGDIDPQQVASLVERAFAEWPRLGETARPDLPQVPVPSTPQTVPAPVPNKTQVDIALGFPGLSRGDPAYYRADLMNYLLGRAFMSRLNMRIREELGLAYYVWSNYYAYWGPGPWVLHMGVNPANTDKALSAALEELRRLQQEPPSEEELNLWKDYVQGTVAREMETYSGIAQNLVLSAFYDLGLYFPYQYPTLLKAITADEVHQAAQQFLHPEGYVAVIAGPVEPRADRPLASPEP